MNYLIGFLIVIGVAGCCDSNPYSDNPHSEFETCLSAMLAGKGYSSTEKERVTAIRECSKFRTTEPEVMR